MDLFFFLREVINACTHSFRSLHSRCVHVIDGKSNWNGKKEISEKFPKFLVPFRGPNRCPIIISSESHWFMQFCLPLSLSLPLAEPVSIRRCWSSFAFFRAHLNSVHKRANAYNLNGVKLWFIKMPLEVMERRRRRRLWWKRNNSFMLITRALFIFFFGAIRLNKKTPQFEWKNPKYRSLICKNEENQCRTTRECSAGKCEWALVGSFW